MSDSIQQTLRKSREVQQKYQLFLQNKKKADQQMKKTQLKIQQTFKKLEQTRKNISSIDQTYQKFQLLFGNVLDKAFQSIRLSLGQLPVDQDFKPWNITPKQFIQHINNHKNIVVITGAGISVASGIPTFRGNQGFWTKQKQKDMQISPQQILTNQYFRGHPFKTWKWIQDFNQLKLKNKPNKGHIFLAQILNQLRIKGKKVTLVSQNIDNYHIQARDLIQKKSKDNNVKNGKHMYDIFEIHGNTNYIRCDKCCIKKKQLVVYPYNDYRKSLMKQQFALCQECKQQLKPHVMFFDDTYDEIINKSDSAEQRLNESDLVITIGTSLCTGLVIKLVRSALQSQKAMIDINLNCEIQVNKVKRMEGKSQNILQEIRNHFIKK